MSLKKSIGVNSILTLAIYFLSFVVAIWNTNLLGATEKGWSSIYFNALSFSLVFCTFGINGCLVYVLNNYKNASHRLIENLFYILLLSTGLLIVAMYLLFQNGYGSLVMSTLIGLKYYILFVLSFFFAFFYNLLVSVLQWRKLFSATTSINLFFLIVQLLAYFFYNSFFVKYFSKIDFVFYLYIVVQALSTTACLILYFRNQSTYQIHFENQSSYLETPKILFQIGILFYIANLAQFLSYKLDLWFVQYYGVSADVGRYSVALSLSQIFWVIPSLVSTILYVYAGDLSSERNLSVTIKSIKFLLYGSFIMATLFILSLYYLIPLILVSDFLNTKFYFLYLMPGVVIYTIAIAITQYFNGIGKFKFNIIASVFGFLVSLVLYPVLISKYNIIGACIGTNISYFVSSLVLLYLFKNHNQLSYRFILLTKNDLQEYMSICVNMLSKYRLK